MKKFDSTYLGEVVDNMDPLYEGRCRVRVYTLFDELAIEDIPWAIPAGKPMFFGQDARAGSLSIPKKGSIVKIKFDGGSIYSPEYYQVQEIAADIKEELRKRESDPKKYDGAHFILFDGDEKLRMWFDRAAGLRIELKESFIQIQNDNSHIEITHKDNLSSISLEDNVIRIVSNSEVNVTSSSAVNIKSNSIKIDGKNVHIGPSNGFSSVLGEELFSLLSNLATMIDAKMPVTAGAAQLAVNLSKVTTLSRTVKVSR